MDAAIIAQKTEQRYNRALQIASAAGAITANGQPHTYYVASQTGNGNRYLAATPEAITGGIGMCNCRDFQDFARHYGFPCKHIQAARIYVTAEDFVRQQAEKHDLTWQRVIDVARHHLQHATDANELARWHIVIVTATRLKESDNA